MYKRQAEQGSLESMYNLGIYYYENKDIKGNLKEAMKWWRKLAERDDAEAQFKMGMCYMESGKDGVNLSEAIRWFGKAAEQGHAEAQYNYYSGNGVERDLKKAEKLYRAAAEQGNVGGQCNLGMYYIQEKRDNVIGYAWIFLSVKNGLEDLTSKLAELEKQMDKGEIERAKKLAEEYSKGNFDK